MTRTACITAAALCALLSVRLWAAPAAGEVVYLDGEVTIDGKEAVEGQPVGRGATIRTGSASICEVTFGDSNIIQVQAGSTVTLELGALTPGLRVRSGSVAAVLNKVSALSPNGKFRVRTSSAVAGVRGTVFFVKVEDASNSYICACNGQLGVTAPLGALVQLAASHHTARRFTRVGLGSRVSPVGLLYHDDRTMQLLATRIGYTVPWGEGSYGK